MAIWNSPKIGDKHGLFLKPDWERLVQFLADQKVLPETMPADRVFTNDLIEAINSYDRAAVVSEAKKEDLSKLR